MYLLWRRFTAPMKSASPKRLLRRPLVPLAGFSLIEVVLAIGVVSFAFVGILGLLPAGLSLFRQATDMSVGAQILQKVTDDARQMDFATLVDAKDTGAGQGNPVTFRAPLAAAPGLRYFDESGGEIVPASAAASQDPSALSASEKTQIVYYVSIRIVTATTLPANAAGNGGAPVTGRYLATVTVQIADNPGNARVSFDANKLFVAAPGISVKTFSVLLAKND